MVRYSGVLGVEEPHQSILNLVVKLYYGDDTVGEVPFFEGTSGSRSSGDAVGPVAQRIRARGYEPRIDDCIFDALLVLVHLRILNWIVVNSPKAMEQRSIPDLHRGVDGNVVSLCMKIINSVVVVGLYYGFLTTFSIGPSYLFLLQAHVMEEGEEGAEKKVSATTGFITGQLIMFISIYYAPLHLALGRPHTITVLALPYLLFHFFCNNHKHFFDYGSTTRNSMRNLSIQSTLEVDWTVPTSPKVQVDMVLVQ
ncbi:hypothetical protein E3N88_19950 [Mikania micrantha]|uniref:Protein TIC 214 n=1 Tax=Mikania micrantha TaxID=192012 RepID=A0A5N6NGW1_9ASTR|nr:hypothetical protein E3N88_19950 [Mikania micrantha]